MSLIKIAPPIVNPVKKAFNKEYKHHLVAPMKQFITSAEGELQELYLPLVLLLGYEEDAVEANAYADTLALFKGKSPKTDEPSNWKELLEANRAYWSIYYSARLPTDLETKWFDSKQEVQKIYSWDTANVIMNHYATLKMTQPCYHNIDWSSPTVFQDILDQIKSFGSEDKTDFFFNGMNTHTINSLLKYLIKKQETSPKNNG